MLSKPQLLSKSLASLFWSVIPFAMVALSIFFLYRHASLNHQLITETNELRAELEQLKTIAVGDAIPPIDSTDLEGTPASILFNDSQRHLIFVYSIHCKFCVEEFPVWNDLIRDLENRELRIHALALETDANSSIDKQLGHLRKVSIVSPGSDLRRTYRVFGTPTVILASGAGVVEWSRVGRLSAEDISQIKEKVSLSSSPVQP